MASPDDTRFDASQYKFFGEDILEDLELGGFEEQENDEISPAMPDYDYHFSTEDKGLAEAYASVSHIDDLSSTFAKLNRAASEPITRGGLNANRSSISRESSSTLDWIPETDHISWSESRQTLNVLYDSDTMIRWSNLPLLRSSSSPQPPPPPPLHRHLTLNPNHSLLPPEHNFSSPFGTSQSPQSLNLRRHSSIPSLSCSSRPSLPNFLPYPPPYGNFDLASLSQSLSFISQEQQNRNLSPYVLNPQIQNHNEFRVQSNRGKQKDTVSTTSGTGTGTGTKSRSKYMSFEELQSVARTIDSRAHGDQYVKDYYHQALLFKKGILLHDQFFPSSVRDIDTVDPNSVKIKRIHAIMSSGSLYMKRSPLYNRSLEKEPMFAARVLIDDGFNLLLDIDDINRMLLRNNVSELKRHRQNVLERLAASLQLVDPLGSYAAAACNTLNDDQVFLCVISLPKGRRLVARYLHLIPPGTELARVVCMAVFRHLRSLFGVVPAERAAAEATSSLALTVSKSVHGFEIGALSACLAAVVCSLEQPPLRPVGSTAGDGATVVLKSVIDRATNLLTDPNAPSRYFMTTLNLWQASFGAFFTLLMNYCGGKIESVLRQLIEPSAADVARMIGKELPVELLHAILPHANENQRKMLFEFLKRYMPSVPG